MALSLFSSGSAKKTKSNIETIPPEVFRSVRTMNDPHSSVQPPISGTGVAIDTDILKKTQKVGSSPFLEGVATKRADSEQVAPAAPSLSEEKFRGNGLPPAAMGSINSNKPKKSSWIVLIMGGVLLLGTIIAVSYWFFVLKPRAEKSLNTVEDTAFEASATIPAEGVSTPPPYSINAPNYLSLDTEEVTLEDIQKSIREAGNRITEANMSEPVEFIITDKKNNPLAFSRLAYLTNITLSPELLSTLGEAFSLFLYNDAGSIHLGAALSLTNFEDAAALLQKEEGSVPRAFQTLFYSGLDVPTKVTFKSGSSDGGTVRFVNIDEARNYSFDYMLQSSEWLIGTSKNTLRALLDKK